MQSFKTCCLMLLLLFTIVATVNGQTYSKVTFITGYPRTDLWEGVQNYLNQTFYLNPYRASISIANSNTDLHNQLSGNQWIGIGHSRGGVVARDYIRQYGANAKLNRVITLGSPNLGANILSNVDNGNIAAVANFLVYNVSKGPIFSLVPSFYPALNHVTTTATSALISVASQQADLGALAHLKPGSTYLNTLNSANESFQRAGIYGVEYWHRPVRTAGAFLGDETGWVNTWNTGDNVWWSVAYFYGWYGNYHYDLFWYYLRRGYYLPELWYGAMYFWYASSLWMDGSNTLYYYFDTYWDINMGVPYGVAWGWFPYLLQNEYSDGIISTRSQKYPNVTADWNYMAEGANHAEERGHTQVAFRARDIFLRWGVQQR